MISHFISIIFNSRRERIIMFVNEGDTIWIIYLLKWIFLLYSKNQYLTQSYMIELANCF